MAERLKPRRNVCKAKYLTHKHLTLALISSVFLLSACATTGVPSSKAIDRSALSAEFVQMEDGGKYQAKTGLLCPPVIGGMTLEDTHSYIPDGTDVSCGHFAEGRELTTYLYPVGEYDFDFIFRDAATAVLQARPEMKFIHDPTASQACTLGGLLMAIAVNDQGTSGDGIGVSVKSNKNKTNGDDTYTYETAIFTNDTILTALTLHEVDGQFLKLRYSEQMLDTSDKIRHSEICAMLSNVTQNRHNDILNPPKL